MLNFFGNLENKTINTDQYLPVILAQRYNPGSMRAETESDLVYLFAYKLSTVLDKS